MWGRRCWNGWGCLRVIGLDCLRDFLEVFNLVDYNFVYSSIKKEEEYSWSWRVEKSIYNVFGRKKINGISKSIEWIVSVFKYRDGNRTLIN